ncbi:hypothetical protein GT755_06210 [Herbidospora sp. NEAU-GS84]|uniref:FtsX-like permease family protein n=1 Tax=Herbidospora solisilvae TaxID=2696284 RepID=A0A7C9NEZ7_9ACTN|nr:hypothetical protein [Herbidospora solisilvae]NAS21278.1 hypothetical protein [Herbidospora solisilvae]
MIAPIVFLLIVILGIPATFVCGAVIFAARSAPRDRHAHVGRNRLVVGAILSAFGLVAMALIAWSTHEDQHYDDFGSALTALAGVVAGALLIFGLGPFIPWLLLVLWRNASRLPPAFRPAVRPLADRPARTAAGVTTTMSATAVAIAVVIISVAVTAKARADYRPEGRLGALVVEGFSPDQAATVRAVIRQELSGAPIAENNGQRELGHIEVETSGYSYWGETHIGDQALLRYLTGDPSTPYDPETAVVITTGEEGVADSAKVRYAFFETNQSPSTKTIPAITVSPPEPRLGSVFIPAKVVRDLGFHLEPEQLIIDPSLHRTSAIERERLDRRLEETTRIHLEQGYQAPTGWLYVVAVLVLIALLGTLATIRSARSMRLLLRAGGGSAAALRFFVGCRAAFSAALGTAMGACAGCVIGLLLAWPMTAPIDWDPAPRAPFETPWALIAALVVGLPAFAAAIAAFAPVRWLTRSDRISKPTLPPSPVSVP